MAKNDWVLRVDNRGKKIVSSSMVVGWGTRDGDESVVVTLSSISKEYILLIDDGYYENEYGRYKTQNAAINAVKKYMRRN